MPVLSGYCSAGSAERLVWFPQAAPLRSRSEPEGWSTPWRTPPPREAIWTPRLLSPPPPAPSGPAFARSRLSAAEELEAAWRRLRARRPLRREVPVPVAEPAAISRPRPLRRRDNAAGMQPAADIHKRRLSLPGQPLQRGAGNIPHSHSTVAGAPGSGLLGISRALASPALLDACLR